MSKKILVTGSRDFEDGQTVLDAILAERESENQRLIVINGYARGADALAQKAAILLPNVLAVSVPADWNNDGKGAGPIRNAAMLELLPDVVLAFYKLDAANRGTQDCVDKATELGIPVKAYTR